MANTVNEIKGKGRIYISGKITGLNEMEVQLTFNSAMRKLCKEGWHVCNPILLPDTGTDKPWIHNMLIDIKHLLECNTIFMLHNWTDSKGARVERAIAIEMGMTVIYQKPM